MCADHIGTRAGIEDDAVDLSVGRTKDACDAGEAEGGDIRCAIWHPHGSRVGRQVPITIGGIAVPCSGDSASGAGDAGRTKEKENKLVEKRCVHGEGQDREVMWSR